MLPGKWDATLKSIMQVSEKEVARQTADETTLNPEEAELVLQQLRKVALNNLKNGNTVEQGNWASFYVTVKSKGTGEEKEFTPAKIKKVNIQFTCDPAFRKELNRAEFVPYKRFTGKPAESRTP